MSVFKVVTFNIQYGQLWDPRNPDGAGLDIARTIAEIRRLDADIVLLQELEKVVPEQGQIQPPPNFTLIDAALPQYHSAFSYPCPDPDELPFGYGQAILSKEPLYAVESIDLPAPDVTFDFMGQRKAPTKRLLLGARTRLGGRELQLFNVHLQAFFMINCSSDEHSCQRDLVEEHLRASAIPTVLGGDMNSAPDETLVQQFADAGFRTAQDTQITWKRRPYVLDHLFCNDRLEVVNARVVSTDAADHEILEAHLRFADLKVAGDAADIDEAPNSSTERPPGFG